MPPIYGLCCWLSLLYPLAAPGLSMVRDGYEAYTIWVFVSFLVSVLGEEDDGDAEAGLPTPGRRGRKNQRSKYAVVVAKLAADDDSGAHVLPRAFCWFGDAPASRSFSSSATRLRSFSTSDGASGVDVSGASAMVERDARRGERGWYSGAAEATQAIARGTQIEARQLA